MLRVCFLSLMVGLAFSALARPPLQTQFRAAKHDSTRLRLYTELAREYGLKSNSDSSLIYTSLGLELAKKLNTTRYYSDLYIFQAFYFRSKKQYDEAIKVAQLAIDFGKKNKQYAKVERAGYALAVIFADKAYNTGNKQTQVITIRQLFKNIRFSNQYQSFTQIERNYELLSAVYKDNGNDSLAYLYLKKKLSYTTQSETPRQRWNFLYSTFELQLYEKHYAKAKTTLNQLLDFKGVNQDAGVYLYVLSEATRASFKFGKFDFAFSIIQKIENDEQLMNGMDHERMFLFEIERTAVYLNLKNFMLAQKAHDRAVHFSKKVMVAFGDKLLLLKNSQKLSEHQKRFRVCFGI